MKRSAGGRVPYLDLTVQYRSVRQEVDAAIRRVLESGRYVLGPEVSSFEAEFAEYCGVAHGVGTSSGTSALHLALLAAGVGPEDEVITAAYTFVATIAAIRYVGARPVLVDVDPVSWTLDPRGLDSVLGPRTRAVIPVHLFGHPADMEPILERARSVDAIVIEDAAQAHGAQYRGRPVGSLGDVACFSFYPTKNLGACGEAGMVVTDRTDLARQVRRLRAWGDGGVGDPGRGRSSRAAAADRPRSRSLDAARLGFNYRLDEVQAAVLRAKLPYLDRWTEARRQIADRYAEELDGTPVRTAGQRAWARHARHVYGVRVPARDRVRKQLMEHGIETGLHYRTPVHLDPAQADLGYGVGDFPVAESLAREELSLPLYPELPSAWRERVSRTLREVVETAPRGA